jgi:Putative prokaryotic signal transducing protein
MAVSSEGMTGWFKREVNAQTTGNGSLTLTGGDGDQEPVVVWEAANLMEAQIVKGRLESEGIPAVVRGEALGAIYGLTTGSLAAAAVLVPAPLADKALEILNTEVEWDESGDEEEQPDKSQG